MTGFQTWIAPKAERYRNRLNKEERKAERRAQREAEKAAKLAAGIKGAEIDWNATTTGARPQ